MQLNNPKIIRAWTMYDWANSVYSLVITSSIFPIYYENVAKNAVGGDKIQFLGFEMINTVVYAWSLTFSFLLIAILSPILSGIADYSGNKKSFMKFFAYLGSAACAGLFFFTGENIEYGILCSILASVGFAGSIVFYNAYLPEITTPENYDRVSARGFSMGYIGSVLLLIVNLLMVMKPALFGLEEGAMPARISFLMVGLWWAGFSQITFYHLPKGTAKEKSTENIVSKGYRELRKVWQQLKSMPKTKNFLAAFFLYNLGVQTVMYMAASFGAKELQLESAFLISAILLIQLVAIAGAYLFAKISERKGNILSLNIMLFIWIGICIAAYFVNGPNSFLSIAAVVGLVMGGIQSLSRSTYSKLLPPTEDHASFFSFYDVADKMGVVTGTALFGLMNDLTGNMRSSLFPLMAAFILGIILLQFARSPKLEPTGILTA